MNSYLSTSSTFVKIVTGGTLVLLSLIAVLLIISDNNYGLIGGIVLVIFTVGIAAYYYSNSLNEIILEKDGLILRKNFGRISISKGDISGVTRMNYSNLTMTYGSKGVFGFIGSTMDDSYSLVKDRKNMVSIKTDNKKYLVSAEEPEKLISEVRTLYGIE